MKVNKRTSDKKVLKFSSSLGFSYNFATKKDGNKISFVYSFLQNYSLPGFIKLDLKVLLMMINVSYNEDLKAVYTWQSMIKLVM